MVLKNINMVKIYSIKDPETLEIKYIGKTIQSLSKRLSGHITKSLYNRSTHISCWIYSLLKLGKKPIIELIEECDEKIWIEREVYYISYYKDIIYNHSTGGESGSLGYKCTDLHKEKISKSLTGRKRSLKERESISNGRKGMKLSEETKNKIREINKGKKQSIETRIKKSKNIVLQIDKKTNIVLNEFYSLGFAQECTGFLKGNISSACNGRLKTYKGFIWRFKNKI
jgi:hypothetical protein